MANRKWEIKDAGSTRREFIKIAASAAAGAALFVGRRKMFAAANAGKKETAARVFDFKYRTLSTAHLPQVRDWFARLEKMKRISDHKTYLSYIHSFEFTLPKKLPAARSLIVMSLPLKLAAVGFSVQGKKRDVWIPTGYVDDGLRIKDVTDQIYARILKDRKWRVERAEMPLKTLAVRSGLAEYGKNNIAFVDGYGSFHQLLGFYTDLALEDQWGPLNMMRECKGCYICMQACPTEAIREENFVINAGKCLTLYNELPDPFPSWIPARAHHLLVGCLKCQYPCPANEDFIGTVEKLAELNEAETTLALSGKPDKKLYPAICEKLKRFPAVQDFAYFSRNLKLALANEPYPA